MTRTLRRALAATALSASLLTATAAPAVAAPPAVPAVCYVIVITPDAVYVFCIEI